jgi:DNA-directed RNA polymerase I, II, and III subunit RPABC1
VSLEEFHEWAENREEREFRKEMEFDAEKPDTEDIIRVMWPLEPKLGTEMRAIASEMSSDDIHRAIIIVDVGITSTCQNLIRHLSLQKPKTVVDVYTLHQSQFNIMRHRLVPRHVLCSIKEKRTILNAYALTDKQLPQIKLSDPAVRHLGATKGQLIKIIRDSDTQKGKKSIHYRIVS